MSTSVSIFDFITGLGGIIVAIIYYIDYRKTKKRRKGFYERFYK